MRCGSLTSTASQHRTVSKVWTTTPHLSLSLPWKWLFVVVVANSVNHIECNEHWWMSAHVLRYQSEVTTHSSIRVTQTSSSSSRMYLFIFLMAKKDLVLIVCVLFNSFVVCRLSKGVVTSWWSWGVFASFASVYESHTAGGCWAWLLIESERPWRRRLT